MYGVRKLGLRGVQVTSFVALALLASSPAGALPIAFTCSSNIATPPAPTTLAGMVLYAKQVEAAARAAQHCAIGASQLSGDLTGNMLTITMTGTENAVVDQVLVEGAGVSGISFDSSVALGIVAFGTGAGAGSSAASNPVSSNGIGWQPADETSPQAGKFIVSGNLSDLSVGVYVTGFASQGGASFVGVPTPTPEPSALLVFSVGGLIVAHQIRRRRR